VDWIADVLDVGSRSLAIRVELDNPEGLLRPGLLGSLHLSIAESGASSLWLPQAAVQAFEGSAVIFVAGHEEGTFEAREVELGRRDEARVEILGGLDAADAVVLENAFILRSELMRSSLGHGHAH
jgi:cobalt-zinc-cadmium efflux system membrane fusion protein